MKSLRLTQQTFQKKTASKAAVEIPAFLGDHDGTVKSDDFGNVYVILFNGQVITAKNSVVPPLPRLPVIIGYDEKDPTLFIVLRARNTYLNPPYIDIPNHAEKNHEEFGIDPVRVNGMQFYPGLAYPIAETLQVQFYGYVYYLNGWHILNSQQVDFTSYVPATGAQYVLAEVDENKVISLRAGTLKDTREALTYEDIPAPSATKKPLFAAKMYANQTRILYSRAQKDIVDLRWAGIATGGASIALWGEIAGDVTSQADLMTLFATQEEEIESAPVLISEDLTAQIDGATDHFDLSTIARSFPAIYCNVRLQNTEITMDDDWQGFTLSFVPGVTDHLIVDYSVSRAAVMFDDSVNIIYDDNNEVILE